MSARAWAARGGVGVTVLLWLLVGVAGAGAYGMNYWLHRGFTPPAWPGHVPHGTARTVTIFSPSMRRRISYMVYLPAGYTQAAAAGERFPVLYFLHGSPGTAKLTLDVSELEPDVDTLEHQGAVPRMIIVVPSGSNGTFQDDTEWADTPQGRYGSAVIDVVHDVDHRFATLPRRGDRALAGLSEGGYGAVNLLLHHLDLFSVAESWSGYYVQTRTGPFAGASRAQLRANSPLMEVRALGRRLARRPVHVLMYAGMADKSLPAERFGPFRAALRRAGAQVTARIFPGRHTWALWRARTPYSLRWLSTRFEP